MWLFLFLFASFSVVEYGCKAPCSEHIDKEIFIHVKDNQLYMRLAGNANGPIIIMLHGGPGGSSGFDREFYKQPMEGQFLMAYLDQRGSGKSPGEENDSLLTMEQFVADLDAVVNALGREYPNRPVHLLGASWGGTYGFLYLLEHPGKIRSFIAVSAKVDGLYENKVLIAHEMQLVQAKLASLAAAERSNTEADTLRHIATELARIQKSDFDHFFEDVELLKYRFPKQLDFNPYWFDSSAHQLAIRLGKDSGFYARAHYDMASYDTAIEKGTHVNKVFRNTPAYNHLQLTAQLAKIQVPVCVIGGAEDYVVGPGHAQLIYEGLSSLSPQQKELHVLQGAAHNINLEAAERYYPIIKAFLARHP